MGLEPWQSEILDKGELYRVGGAVRDRVMGIEGVADTDYLVRVITFARQMSSARTECSNASGPPRK